MNITSQPVCVAPTGDRCGEGVLWHPEEEAVYWTDINRFLIHRFDPADASVRSWFFNEPVTTVLLTDRENTLAVVLGSRIILWAPASDSRDDQGFRLPNWPAVRLNDAGVDPRGSIWAGSMRNNVNSDGSEGQAGGLDGILFRIDPDGSVSEQGRDIGIANTIVWSPDRTRFYFADSLANTVLEYHYDESAGTLGNPRPFLNEYPRGDPDGSTMDEEGHLWNCRWGGSCIVRIAPTGAIQNVIEMPTRNITNCTFGGKNLDTLYVTTAASPIDTGDRLAGSLFAIQTKTRGIPENRFGLPA